MGLSHTPKKLLFFSRGRGQGHAFRDLEIERSLRKLVDVQTTFVSYGTGLSVLQRSGVRCLDLRFPDDNPFIKTIIKAGRVIRDLRPDVVFAHEEMAAVTAASIFNLPSIFITDWFLDPTNTRMRALEDATRIYFLEDPGIFTEPPALRGKVEYVGPIIRSLSCSAGDKQQARLRLNISATATVIIFVAGTTNESVTPVQELVLTAFDRLPFEEKTLIWNDNKPPDAVVRRAGSSPQVVLSLADEQLDWRMVASDCAITKCTRNTLRELSLLGVPSISLSHGANWIDDVLANRLPNNLPLDARVTSAEQLKDALLSAIAQVGRAYESPRSATGESALDRLASSIAGFI